MNFYTYLLHVLKNFIFCASVFWLENWCSTLCEVNHVCLFYHNISYILGIFSIFLLPEVLFNVNSKYCRCVDWVYRKSGLVRSNAHVFKMPEPVCTTSGTLQQCFILNGNCVSSTLQSHQTWFCLIKNQTKKA